MRCCPPQYRTREEQILNAFTKFFSRHPLRPSIRERCACRGSSRILALIGFRVRTDGWVPSGPMTTDAPPTGVLLLQLGTPDSPDTADVRRYLREFLSDPRVLDIPPLGRALLLNAVILPFRPRRSAHAYRLIWTDQGSPLTIHAEELRDRMAVLLGPQFRVAFGMRYANPSISSAVDELVEAGCERLVALPLFPQYASASGGSAVAKLMDTASEKWNVPDLTTIGSFYDDPGFLDAVASVAAPELETFHPDHVLFSYHGLPEKQIRKSDLSDSWCLESEGCCSAIAQANRYCYRAQCFATTRELVTRLGLAESHTSTTFQSRLAGQKWIEPYTDRRLPELYETGVRRLAVLTPSFVADCLETLEEIGIRGRRQWQELGGDDFLLVPCVNASPRWVEAACDLVVGAVG